MVEARLRLNYMDIIKKYYNPLVNNNIFQHEIYYFILKTIFKIIKNMKN